MKIDHAQALHFIQAEPIGAYLNEARISSPQAFGIWVPENN